MCNSEKLWSYLIELTFGKLRRTLWVFCIKEKEFGGFQALDSSNVFEKFYVDTLEMLLGRVQPRVLRIL